jgi:hypothetical protein
LVSRAEGGAGFSDSARSSVSELSFTLKDRLNGRHVLKRILQLLEL